MLLFFKLLGISYLCGAFFWMGVGSVCESMVEDPEKRLPFYKIAINSFLFWWLTLIVEPDSNTNEL